VFGARVHIKGWAAAAWGVAWLGAALVMHAHFFWGNRRFGRSVAVFGNLLGLALVALGVAGFVIINLYEMW